MNSTSNKTFHSELPASIKEKLQEMSYEERQELLEQLMDPSKRIGVFVEKDKTFYQAV